jgi:hypothetical protein
LEELFSGKGIKTYRSEYVNENFDLGLVYLLNMDSEITKEELLKASLERSDSVQTLAQRLLNQKKQ